MLAADNLDDRDRRFLGHSGTALSEAEVEAGTGAAAGVGADCDEAREPVNKVQCPSCQASNRDLKPLKLHRQTDGVVVVWQGL